MEKSTLAVLLVILACAVWSTMGVYSHVTHVSIMALTVIRLSIPTLLLTPLLQWRHVNRMALLWHPWSLLIMALNLIRAILYFWGFHHLPVGQAILLLYTWPLMLALIGRLFLKQTFDYIQLTCGILALIGIGLIQSPSLFDFSNWSGVIAMLTCALTNAWMLVALKQHPTQLSAIEQVWIQNGLGGLVILPFAGYSLMSMPAIDWFIVSGISLLVGVIGYFLFFKAMQLIPAVSASLLAYLEVVFTLILGAILLQQPITTLMMIGGSMILLGSMGVQWALHRAS